MRWSTRDDLNARAVADGDRSQIDRPADVADDRLSILQDQHPRQVEALEWGWRRR
jgi:hypothetical protein